MPGKRIRSAASIALAWTTCIALVAACAGGPRLRYRHEFSLAPGQQHHAGLAKALLVPLDHTNADPIKGLDVSNEKIASLIVAHFESKGIAVERVDPVRFRRIADEAHRAEQIDRKSGASGVVSSEVTIGDLVPRILEKLDSRADLVVDANVVLRTGEWNGGRALIWDGVRRRDRTAGQISWSGTTQAASLEVAVHSADGTRVFSGYGGLDLVYQFNLQEKIMEVRPILLQDEQHLAEGICVAFYPYFGVESSCHR